MKNIGELPAEIILLILEQVTPRYIYPCTLVNKQFYIAANPLLWRTLSVDSDDDVLPITSCLRESLHGGQYVSELYLGYLGYFTMTDSLLLQWLPHLPNLELLYVSSGDALSDTSMQHLPHYCPKLRNLQLHYSTLTKQSILALGQHCHHLHTLDLYGCSQLTSDVFSTLTACPLESVTLGVNYSMGLDWMTVEETLVDLTWFSLLKTLSLTRASIPFIKHLLSTTTGAWPRLTRLILQECDDLGDHELVAFIKTHLSLKVLSLVGVDLTDATLDAIGTYLGDRVTYVNLCRNKTITSHGIRRMVHQCHKLTGISLYACGQTSADFPEVGLECVETLVRRRPWEQNEKYVHRLDQDTINEIRRRAGRQ